VPYRHRARRSGAATRCATKRVRLLSPSSKDSHPDLRRLRRLTEVYEPVTKQRGLAETGWCGHESQPMSGVEGASPLLRDPRSSDKAAGAVPVRTTWSLEVEIDPTTAW
jgi:hypothetical protein